MTDPTPREIIAKVLAENPWAFIDQQADAILTALSDAGYINARRVHPGMVCKCKGFEAFCARDGGPWTGYCQEGGHEKTHCPGVLIEAPEDES